VNTLNGSLCFCLNISSIIPVKASIQSSIFISKRPSIIAIRLAYYQRRDQFDNEIFHTRLYLYRKSCRNNRTVLDRLLARAAASIETVMPVHEPHHHRDTGDGVLHQTCYSTKMIRMGVSLREIRGSKLTRREERVTHLANKVCCRYRGTERQDQLHTRCSNDSRPWSVPKSWRKTREVLCAVS
jgi:hypothetical protein